jgi:triphosphoribosyl-dephospho-CoA synthase
MTSPAASAKEQSLGRLVQRACELEATAPKPGNVSPGRPFADVRFEDFVASADAIRDPLSGAGSRPLGDTIWLAVEATSRRARANTNLGIVLLMAPLARAASLLGDSADKDSAARMRCLRPQVDRVLAKTTVHDARQAYRAIRLANPGGLGSAAEQDVASDPSGTLFEVMRLAMHRDGIAREYATAFETTFELSVPTLLRARADGLGWNDAIVETYLTVLAAAPDTHVIRRGGEVLARQVSGRAAAALAAGGVRTDAGRAALSAMDDALRDPLNIANPGTSADLIAAAVFVVLFAEEGQ